MKRLRLFILFFLWLVSVCSSQSVIDSLKKLLEKQIHDTARVNILIDIGGEYYETNVKLSCQYSDEAYGLASKINFVRGMASAVFNRGNANYFAGDVVKAEQDFLAAGQYYAKAKNLVGCAKSRHSLGMIMAEQGDYSGAVEHYLAALKLYEHGNYELGVGSELLNIGVIYSDQKNFKEALEFQAKAIEKFRKLGKLSSLANALTRQGNTYWAMDSLKKAQMYYDTAMKFFSQAKVMRGVGIVYNNLAGVLNDEGRYKESLVMYQKALKIREGIGDANGAAIVMLNIGETHAHLADPLKAIPYLEKSLAAFLKTNDRDSQKEIYKYLAQCYSQLGNFEKAFNYQNKFIVLNDSIQNAEGMAQVHELNKKYNTEKKDRELELKDIMLQKQNLESQRQKVMIGIFLFGSIVFLGFAFFMIYAFRKIRRSKNEVALAYAQLHEKNKEVLDSIYYAKRIQLALLTPEKFIQRSLKRLKNEK